MKELSKTCESVTYARKQLSISEIDVQAWPKYIQRHDYSVRIGLRSVFITFIASKRNYISRTFEKKKLHTNIYL